MAKFRHFKLKTSEHWPAVFTNKNSKWYAIGRKELIPDKSSQLQEAIKSRKIVYTVGTESNIHGTEQKQCIAKSQIL